MKPTAAIWHIPNRGQGGGDYPVAVVSILPAQALGVGLQATVVDVTGRLRTAPADEIEVVDADVTAALTQAQTRLTGAR